MADDLPIEPLGQARLAGPAAAVLGILPATVRSLVRRAPPIGDSRRWQDHEIGGRRYAIARPVTFTPYAAVRACSARCRFCSEGLRLVGAPLAAARLRPGPGYFARLTQALRQLRGLALGYSLSGLEFTDDPAWMAEVLAVLGEHARHSPVADRVLYTNTAGFATPSGGDLIERLRSLAVRLEVSRHAVEEARNRAIMRFRPGVAVAAQPVFEATLRALRERLEVALVCLVQRGGVETASQVRDYLAWARGLGIGRVIFREFSALSPRHRPNAPARYITGHRVDSAGLLGACLASPEMASDLRVSCLTEGYYFWNVTGTYQDLPVTFEAADYATLLRAHASGRVYKLVFHANGNLCAGWNPAADVLWSAGKAGDGPE